MTTQTTQATYTKLRDGSWGLRGTGLSAGRSVTVSTKAGATKRETVGRILWTGDGIVLATIATASRSSHQSARPVYASRPATRREQGLRALVAGEQTISRDSSEYTVGQVVHMRRDGSYWTVVAESSHRISDVEDDTREGERRYDAIVRPATEDERETRAAEIAASTARQIRAAELETALRASRMVGSTDARAMHVPAESTVIWADRRGAGSECWYQAPDGTVWYCRSSYDDMPATWQTTATVAQITEAQSLGLQAGIW